MNFMNALEYNAYICPVDKTLELMSGRWKPIILYLVQHGFNRFGQLKAKMPKISKKVLTEQLRHLESQGLINRKVVVNKHPQEVVYSLTDRGSSLRNLIDQIFAWGINNLLDEASRDHINHFIISDVIHQ